MYELESYEDFKKLVDELDEKYKKEKGKDWEWGGYPSHDRIMYEALKKYIEDNFLDGKEVS